MPSATRPLPYAYPAAPRFSAAAVVAIVAIVAAHAALIALLTSLKVASLPLPPATTMVEIVAPTPPAVAVAAPRPSAADLKPPARPRVQPPQPPTELPRLAAANEAASAATSVATPGTNPPTPALAPSAGPTSASTASDDAAATAPPRFDANYLQNPAPAYPPQSRRFGEQGRVVLRVLVDRHGRPTQIEVKTSSGSARLDQAAQDAVGRWKFVAAQRGDEAVDAWVLVPIVFNLRS